MQQLLLFYSFLALNSLNYIATSSELKTLHIPDAGRGLEIGALYDHRTETFVQGAYLRQDIDGYVQSMNSPSVSIDYSNDMSIRSRLKLLDIALQASMSFFVFLVLATLKGSVKLINENRSTTKSIRVAARYRSRNTHKTIKSLELFKTTPSDSIVFGGKEEKCSIEYESDGKHCIPATHFVSAITYGSDVNISFESWYKNSYEKAALTVGIKASVVGVGIKVKIPGYDSNKDNKEFIESHTTVRVYGDFELGEQMPSTVEETLDFIRRLPTIVGGSREVPMDIVLTPLSWIDNNFPKINIIEIDESIVLRLTEVYDGLESAEARILDLLTIEHKGFIAWKDKVDAYLRDFIRYKVKFQSTLQEKIILVKNGTNKQNTINNTLLEYWNITNRYNQHSVRDESEKMQNTIMGLLALSSQFNDLGITFADNLSDFYGPTIDLKYDRVYALILVGMQPEQRRKELKIIRKFVNLAKSRKNPSNGDNMITHCMQNISNETKQCRIETQAFVAIHLDSFCGDLCDPQPFCPLQDQSNNCQLVGENSACNKMNPFNDCWCSCPETQVVQFVRNQNPERLDENMPSVPAKPIIANIQGYSTNQTERYGKNQKIEVVMNHSEDNALQWKVTLDYSVLTFENRVIRFVPHEKIIVTKTKQSRIIIRDLSAGQTYDVYVSGMNSIGEGKPSEMMTIQVGHRLVDISSYAQVGDSFFPILPSHLFPSWLSVNLNLTLSVGSTSISQATIHYNENPVNSVDSFKGNPNNMTDLYAKCSDPTKVTLSSASCTMSSDTVLMVDKDMELRIWDDSNLLLAKKKITVLSPSHANCNNFGDNYTISCKGL